MDSPKISRMWVDLQKASHRLRESSTLSKCEAEVKELMHQVDLMVDARKQEWAKEKRTLQSKLDVREQEIIIHKATLAQKHNEISQLRFNLDSMEQSHRETKIRYETDLANLREQVGGMKREYDKLQRRYLRHSSRDKQKDSGDELERKYLAKLEDYRKQSADWDRERHCLRQQIEALESQNKILGDKCSLVAQTSTDLKNQLDKKHEMLSDSEQGLRGRIKQLSTFLDQSKDTINSQEVQISRLKSALDDSYAAQRKALEDKEQMEARLRADQQAVRKMEDEALEFRINLETQQRLVQALQQEQAKLNQQNLQLQIAIQDKDSIVQSSQTHSISPTDGAQLRKLQTALARVEAENKAMLKTEQQLQAEIAKLQADVTSLRSERDQLKIDLKKRHQDTNALKQLKIDNKKLQKELADRQTSQESAGVERHQRESDPTGSLAQLTAAVNEKNSRIATLENIVCDQKEQLQKCKVEFQVVQSQLHACRVEIRHLRRVPDTTSETQFEELQTSYRQSLDALERLLSVQRDKTLDLESKLNAIRYCEVQNKELIQKIADLEQELLNKEIQLRNLGRSNEAMSSFVDGVNQIVRSPRSETCSSALSTSRTGNHRNHVGGATSDNVELMLAEQEDRTRDLEDLLAHHMNDLRTMTDETLCKFIPAYSRSSSNGLHPDCRT